MTGKRLFAVLLAAALAAGTLPLSYADDAPLRVSVIFTHDMHSHIGAERYSGAERGGFAKLKSLIDGIKYYNPDSFVLDAGDFSMGTPFQTLFASDAPELKLMGLLGYDAATLGNHEFDYGPDMLAGMLRAAKDGGGRLPVLFSANIDWDKTLADPEKAKSAENLRSALDAYGAEPGWRLISKGGATMAVFGLMGKEADSYAPESGLFFEEQIKYAKRMVKEIREDGRADLIVCLSHSGTNSDSEKSEDEILAEKVPEIDLIISGHTHTVLETPKTVGGTTIVSCGSYLQYAGHVTLTKIGERLTVAVARDYRLYTLGSGTPEDEEIAAVAGEYKERINRDYFSKFGYEYDEVLAESEFDFPEISKVGETAGESTLGNFLADALLYAVGKTEGAAYEPVSVTAVPLGVIRASLVKGGITAAEAFNTLSMGIGEDGSAGYPAVGLYLTGAELKTLAEVDISVGDIMKEARMYFSGLTFTYNTERLMLNRVTDVMVNGEPVEDDKLYRVAADMYSALMLGTVESKSFGLLKLVPKDKNGAEITDWSRAVIRGADGAELKEWQTVAMYLQSEGAVSPRYERVEGRKTLTTKRGFSAMFKQPNKVFFLAAGLSLLVILILALTIAFAVIRARGKQRERTRRAADAAERARFRTENFNKDAPEINKNLNHELEIGKGEDNVQ